MIVDLLLNFLAYSIISYFSWYVILKLFPFSASSSEVQLYNYLLPTISSNAEHNISTLLTPNKLISPRKTSHIMLIHSPNWSLISLYYTVPLIPSVAISVTGDNETTSTPLGIRTNNLVWHIQIWKRQIVQRDRKVSVVLRYETRLAVHILLLFHWSF